MGNPKYDAQRVEQNEKKHISYKVFFPTLNPFKLTWYASTKVNDIGISFRPSLTVEEIYDRVDRMMNRG